MKFDCSLYLVADTGTTERRKLDKKVELAIRGGCTMVQLREKNGNMKEFYHDAAALRRITDTYGIPLIINDRLDLMLAIDAPGIHVGQSDMPASVVRRLIGAEKIMGVSAHRGKIISYTVVWDHWGLCSRGARTDISSRTQRSLSRKALKDGFLTKDMYLTYCSS